MARIDLDSKATVAKVNAALAAHGCKEQVRQGDGYVYFTGGDSSDWYSSSIHVNKVGQMTVRRVMEYFDDLRNDSLGMRRNRRHATDYPDLSDDGDPNSATAHPDLSDDGDPMSATRGTRKGGSATSTRSEVRSPTSTRTEVRSPTSTSTKAHTSGNFTATVTGGAGAGNTSVTIRPNKSRRNPVQTKAQWVEKMLTKMLNAYMATALWSSTDEDGTPLEDDYNTSNFSEEAVASMAADCASFLEAHGADVDEFMLVTGKGIAQVGHDFWLTRNRHGAGFWDEGAGAVGKRLTDAAHAFGSQDIMIDDRKNELSVS